MSSSVRCVACTAVVSRPEDAVRRRAAASGSRRTPPGTRRSRRPARRGGRAAAAGGPLGERRRRHAGRAAPRGRSGARRRPRAESVAGAARRPARAQASAVPSENRTCTPSGGAPNPLREVAGVEQRDPQPGVAGGLDQGERPWRSGRRRAGRRAVVQVVELADAVIPASDHLAVGRTSRARSRCPGRGARRRRTSARARSRTCRARAGCGPRRARWNAWLWQLARPGMVRPGRRSAALGRCARLDRRRSGRRSTSTSTSSATPSGEPGALAAVRSSRRQLRQTCRRGPRRPPGSRPSRRTRRASARRRWGCARTASRSGCPRLTGCRRRARPAVGMIGQSPMRRRDRGARSGSKSTDRTTDSAVTVTAVPSRSARSVRLPRDRLDQLGQRVVGRSTGRPARP